MTAQLVARGLRAGFGARMLFSDLDLVVAPGDVIGLVGPNGAGKSTLLRILAGLDQPEAGTVTMTPPGASVGYLAQEVERVPGEDISSYIARTTGVGPATSALEAAADGLARGDSGAGDTYAAALERYLALGGADLSERFLEVSARVGLPDTPGQEMATLSGGEAARVGLAALLLSRYDVLLLDEPTNDLDLQGLNLIEEFVTQSRAGIMVVSHDRRFLSRVANRVLDFDPALQLVTEYAGGYEAYLTERLRARSAAQEAYEEHVATKEELLERARRARESSARGSRNAQRAYATGKVDKLTRDRMVDGATGGASAARRAQRAVDRLPEVVEPRKQWQLRLSIVQAAPSGQVVAVLDGAVLRLGDFQLGPVSLRLDRGDRVVITGPNGSGKSSLLALLTGFAVPASGRAHLGAGVVIGRIEQGRETFSCPDPPMEVLGRQLPGSTPEQVRTLLAKFGISGSDALRPGDTLSAGERTRAGLALLAARGVNLLVLDEPTNHLDLAAIEQLESAIAGFDGTLLLVTHDRALLDAVSATRRWEVRAGQVIEM